MAKKIIIDKKPNKKSIDIVDQWVESGTLKMTTSNEKSTIKKKITISVDVQLHKKIKLHCTHHDIKIKDCIIEILKKEFIY